MAEMLLGDRQTERYEPHSDNGPLAGTNLRLDDSRMLVAGRRLGTDFSLASK
jgi:hypothetical protein